MFFALFFLFSTPDSLEFENIRVNSDSVDNYHNEEQIVVNPTDSANLVSCWRDFRLGYRQIGIGYSFDGGITWEDYLIPSELTPFWQDSDPGLTTDAQGNIYLVILSLVSTSDSNALVVLKSTDGGMSFDEPRLAVLSGGEKFEDKELIACDRTDSEHRGNLYVAWARFGSMGPQIYSVTSTDGGETWIDPVPVGEETGVQWPVPCVGSDGTYYIAWVSTQTPYAILLDRSTDGGQTWGADITLTPVAEAITDIDDYYTTFSFPALDADITDGQYAGNLYVAYMDRGANGSYDIFFRRSEDRGSTWSDRIPISGDEEQGNDQFHQWLCVDNTGIIHVIFYDQRNGIADNLLDIYYVYSEDAGATWCEPIRVTDTSSRYKLGPVTSSPWPMPAGPIGEYIGLAAWGGVPFPVWTDFREDGMQRIYFGQMKQDTSVAVAEPTADRSVPFLSAAFDTDGLKITFLPAETGSYEFRLFDAAGRSIATTANSTGFVWNVADLPRGVYFLAVRGTELERSLKIVKLK